MKKSILLVFSLVVVLMASSVQAQSQNIVELAVETESLSTLVTAVKAAGLVETLASEGPFTVFAPTNEAFDALPAGILEDLLKPENKEKLVSVLTYHVIGASVMSGDLQDGMSAATMQGEEVNVDLSDGVRISEAEVISADIKASNGVVHVINQVILPPSMRSTN